MTTVAANIKKSSEGKPTQEFFALSSCFAHMQSQRSAIISHMAGNIEEVKTKGKIKITELDAELKPIMARLKLLSEMDEVKDSVAEIRGKVADFMESENLS